MFKLSQVSVMQSRKYLNQTPAKGPAYQSCLLTSVKQKQWGSLPSTDKQL